jgi:hypothetical protein
MIPREILKKSRQSEIRTNRIVKLKCICVPSLAALLVSCSTKEISMDDFAKLKPFKGKVTKVERIKSDTPMRSVSGPDCRVTVVKEDGATLVIKRMNTLITTVDDLEKLVERQECSLPDEIARYEDRFWKETK